MNSPNSSDIHLVFRAEEIEVRRALSSIRLSLRTLGQNELTRGTTEIVLAEVINNIVEHAYAGKSEGMITLSCRNSGNCLRFEIVDDGKTLPGGEIPPKQKHDLNTPMEEYPEGGFGWGLIRDMTSELRYKRYHDRNFLRFSIPYSK